MKKLCFVILNFNYIGGMEKANANLINELNKLEIYDITLLSLFGKQGEESFKIKKSSHFKIKYLFREEFNIKHLFQRILNKKVTDFVLNAIEEEILLNCYNIVITGDLKEYFSKIKYKNKNKFKLIIWEHFNCTNPHSIKSDLSRFYTLKYTDKLVVLTKRDQKNYIKKFGFKNKVVQIYNAMILQNQYYSNVKQKKIITVGRVVNQKGFDMLIRIGKKVFNKCDGWEWDVYGSGNELEDYKKKVIEEGLYDFIHFCGKNNNMIEIYPNYSIFALTSRYEGLGLVLLEAYSYHLPLISFDCDCGPSEIIDDNENGFLIHCYDCDSYASKLLKLIESYELREKFSNNCNKEIHEFNVDYVVKQWISLFEDLAM